MQNSRTSVALDVAQGTQASAGREVAFRIGYQGLTRFPQRSAFVRRHLAQRHGRTEGLADRFAEHASRHVRRKGEALQVKQGRCQVQNVRAL